MELDANLRIARPDSLLGILGNLKFALVSDLLMREDFYTEINIKDLSGGNEVFSLHMPNVQIASVTGFEHFVDNVRIEDDVFAGIQYNLERHVLKSHKIYASAFVCLLGDHPDLVFERVDDLIGRTWEYENFAPAPTGRRWCEPTHPMGNQRIIYRLDDDQLNRSIVMELCANGSLYNATFAEETK